MKDGYEQFFKKANQAAGQKHGQRSGSQSGQKKRQKFPVDHGTPEQRLRQELADRVQRRTKASLARKRQGFPIFPAICVGIAVASCAVGYVRPDIADHLLGKIEIGVFGSANAGEAKAPAKEAKADAKTEAKAEKPAEVKPGPAEKTAETEAQEKPKAPADFRQWSDEEISFFSKLNDRKKELDLREAELTKLEEELQKQKAELDDKIQQLASMRTDISKTLKSRVANDQEKVDKLVQFYSTMKPQQAAKVIETVNEDLAVEVLDKMKKKNAAEILNMMDAKKARRLSELLTGYQRSTASVEEETPAKETEEN